MCACIVLLLLPNVLLFTSSAQSKYEIVSLDSWETATWYQAEYLCQIRYQTHLAAIRDSSDFMTVTNLTASNNILRVWIGLNDISFEGSYGFHWVDGTECNLTSRYCSQFFVDGSNNGIINEHCVSFSVNKGTGVGYMTEMDCSDDYAVGDGFLCNSNVCNVPIVDSDECITNIDCNITEICHDRNLPNGELIELDNTEQCDVYCKCYCLEGIRTMDPTSISIPTFYPTSTEPTTEPTPNPLFVKLEIDSTLFYMVLMMSSIAAILFILCVFYFFKSNISGRISSFGTASIFATIKVLGVVDKCGLMMEIFDLVTDYLFSIELIMDKRNDPQKNLFGWISLISGIFGFVLFYFKFLTMKKLIGYQIEKIKQEIKNIKTDNMEQKNMKIFEIRQRQIDVDMISLLICCIEDIPQTIIIVVIISSNIGWTLFSLLNVSTALVSILFKTTKIIAIKMGCKDDNIQNLETQQKNQIELQS